MQEWINFLTYLVVYFVVSRSGAVGKVCLLGSKTAI